VDKYGLIAKTRFAITYVVQIAVDDRADDVEKWQTRSELVTVDQYLVSEKSIVDVSKRGDHAERIASE